MSIPFWSDLPCDGVFLGAVHEGGDRDAIIHLNSPSLLMPFFEAMNGILGEALELSPFTKQLFSTDAFGIAESYYLGALLFRRALRRHLDRWIADGTCNAKEAERIVRLIAVDNTRRIYPLQ